MKKMIIVDGNSLLFRAYYATAYSGNIMRTSAGVPTNALNTFANMITKILDDFKGGEHLLVAWDTGGKTLRHQADENYKANRSEAPEDLVPQFDLARDFLKTMGIVSYEQEEYEADDIAGSLAKQSAKDGFQVELFTSDQDFLQLVDHNIVVKLIKNGSKIELMNEKAVLEKYEMTPKQIIDYKGLRGDPSDNIPGVPGIGKVTGTNLIKQYGTMEAVIENAPLQKGKVYQNIVAHAETARLSKKLATIITDLALPLTYDELLYNGYNYEEIAAFASEYEMNQFMAKLTGRFEVKVAEKKQFAFHHITSSNFDLTAARGLYLDIDDEDYHEANLLGLAFSLNNNVYYINKTNLLQDQNLIAWLADENAPKDVFDAKLTEVVLNRYGLRFSGVEFDLLLASYLLDTSLNNDPRAIMSYFNVRISSPNEENNHEHFIGEIAYYVSSLKDQVRDQLKEIDAYKLYQEIELPLAHVLATMELEGFPLNKDKLLEIGESFRSKLVLLTTEIYQLAGHEFNISSPKQVGTVLYDELKLPNLKKGSTAVSALAKISKFHPIVDKILDYRKYAKLISTYIDGLVVDIKEDGKLHTTFNQALTTTGRLSSTKPNLQNISIRDEEGREIRKAFYYEESDLYLVAFDYSQVELRIMAALAESPHLIQTFVDGRDIHQETAKAIFQKEEITPNDRRKAKAVNFGIIYGISDWGLSEQIGASPGEAKEIINSFYRAYPEVSTFLKQTVEYARNDGYVTTLLGRRRYLPGLNDRNYQVREFAKRAAMNAPIQGTAADIIKLAMVKIVQFLSNSNYTSKLVLQIHDELIFVMPKNEIEELSEIIKQIMEHTIELDVPLEVSVSSGKTWFDCL